MSKRPKMWWTTIKGGRRAGKRGPWKWSKAYDRRPGRIRKDNDSQRNWRKEEW